MNTRTLRETHPRSIDDLHLVQHLRNRKTMLNELRDDRAIWPKSHGVAKKVYIAPGPDSHEQGQAMIIAQGVQIVVQKEQIYVCGKP